MIALMPLAGEDGAWSGPLRPSSEWRFHRDIMRARPDVGAIVHTHAAYATALAMLRKPIPAAHYMIAAFGGPTIRCTDYAPFGTQELSDLAVAGLEDRHGVLLGSSRHDHDRRRSRTGALAGGRARGAGENVPYGAHARHAGHSARRRGRPAGRAVQDLWRARKIRRRAKVAATEAEDRAPRRSSPHHTPLLGIEVHGSCGGRGPPFCRSSIEILSGERMKAMWPSRGGRLIVTPAFIRRSHKA